MVSKAKTKSTDNKKTHTRSVLKPSEDARRMLYNLHLAYLVKQMKDPEYTRVKWAADAGFNSAALLSRLHKPDGPMLSLDRAMRLATALNLGLDDLRHDSKDFLEEVMGVSQQEMADHLAASAEKTTGFQFTKFATGRRKQ